MEHKEELEYCHDFITKYFRQDNRCTAYPIYFCIRDIEYVSAYHFSDADRYVMVTDEGITAVGDTLDDLFEYIHVELKGYRFPGYWEDGVYFDEGSVEEFAMLNDIVGIFGESKKEVFKGFFLLEQEAIDHLAANSHHYASNAEVYCNHGWRAPQTEKFFNDLSRVLDEVREV